MYACPTHFGCTYEYREIMWILEIELHFGAFIIAHFCLHVEYIHMIHTILVSHHFEWQTWPGRGQNSIALCGEGAPGSAFALLSCSGRSASHDSLSWSGSGYSAGSLTSIGRNVSLSHQKIRESIKVVSGHSLHHGPGKLLQSSVSPKLTRNMPPAFYVPSMGLKHPVKGFSPQGSSVLLACPESTCEQQCVHYPSVSEWVVFHWPVVIPTTSLKSKAMQSVSSCALHPVELVCLWSG